MPTDRRVLFGHHFAAIAGAGPLVGPVLAAQMGYLPGTMWIIIGVVLAGGVQDYLVLWLSTRRRGRSLGQMARDELGTFGGIAALIAVFVIMIILIAVLALVVVNALAESPWGVFSLAMTIPIALFMGFYLRYPAARQGLRGDGDRRGAAAAGDRLRRLGRRHRLGPELVHPVQGDAGLGDHRLRLRRLGAAGVDAAGPARLPVHLHEGRHDRAAGRGHPDRPADGADARRHLVRDRRQRPRVRRLAVPVPVHHHRLRRAVRLPRADLLGHDAEDAREGEPDPDDRLRRHADRVVRRDHGAGHRGDPRPAPVLRHERPGRADRRHRRDRRGLRQRAGPDQPEHHPGPHQPGGRRRRRALDHLPHRRRADAGVRHVRGAQHRARRVWAARRSGTTSRSCSRRCSS